MSQKKTKPRWASDDDARMSPSLAREMLAAFEMSELSIAAFARLHDLPTHRVQYWRRRLRKVDGALKRNSAAEPSPLAMFAPVIAKPSWPKEALPPAKLPMQTLEATLPGGSRVVVHGQWDVMSMRLWLEAIEGSQC